MGPIVPNGKSTIAFTSYTNLKTDSKHLLDQCALDSNGNLKDASEIDWSYDKDSEVPMAPSQTGMIQSLTIQFKFF